MVEGLVKRMDVELGGRLVRQEPEQRFLERRLTELAGGESEFDRTEVVAFLTEAADELEPDGQSQADRLAEIRAMPAWVEPEAFRGSIGRTMFDTPVAKDNTITVLLPYESVQQLPTQSLVRISGHPDQRTLPQYLGYLRSDDGGRNWRVVSRLGDADLHKIVFKHDRLYAWDAAQRSPSSARTRGETSFAIVNAIGSAISAPAENARRFTNA